jgi:homoserine O-acetyltransferase
MAYETWGTLAPDAGNAVLICHGYTSNPHVQGWWPGLLGPGKAIDTERWFVVCANMLGSAYGSSGPEAVTALQRRFAACPGWNAGHYLDGGDGERSVRQALHALRLDTLRRYGVERHALDHLGSAAAAAKRVAELASQWAREFDANALIALRKANLRFDATPMVGAIRAPLLYVLSRTDVLYPPSLASATIALLRDAGVAAAYVEIDSEYGHFAPTAEWRTWGGALGEFLATHA